MATAKPPPSNASNTSTLPPIRAPAQITVSTPTWQESTALEPFTLLVKAVRLVRNELSGSPAGVGLQPWLTPPAGSFPGGHHVRNDPTTLLAAR